MARKISWLILLFIIAGCYPLSKAKKQTDKAYEHYPAMVAGKASVWFPCKTVDSTVTFDTSKVNDSSAYFKSKADSLLKVKQKILTERELVYKDTCTSLKDEYQSGFNLGYETGYYYGKTEAKRDTFTITITKTKRDSAEIVLIKARADSILRVYRAAKIDAENKLANNVLWKKIFLSLSILEFVLIALFIYLITKRK
jgi:hypothetical protein